MVMSPVEVKVYRQFEDFKKATENFHFETGLETPFLQLSWLENWWEQFGEGRRLHLLVFREDEGVVGFAPFYQRRCFPSTYEFNFIGIKNSNYLGFACKAGYERAITDAIWNHFKGLKIPVALKLMDISSESKIYPVLLERIQTSNKASYYPLYPCPVAELRKDWDTFFKKAIKRSKHRKQMRRKLRRLSVLGDMNFVVIKSPDDLKSWPGLFTQLSDLHAKRFTDTWNPSLQAKNLQFLETVSESLLGKGLIISLILLDDEIISFIICFEAGDTIIDYIPAFNPNFSKFSLGHVHLIYLIQWAIKNGFRIFDFSKGEDIYKRKWATGESNNHLFIFHFNPSTLSNLYNWIEKMKMILILHGRSRGYNARIKKIIAKVRNTFFKLTNLKRETPLDTFSDKVPKSSEYENKDNFIYANFKHLPGNVVRRLVEYRYYHPEDELRLEIENKQIVVLNNTLNERKEFKIQKP